MRHAFSSLDFQTTKWRTAGTLAWLALLAALVLLGLGAAYYMEHHGHWVTGMNNHVVWGLPHVFAVLLIVASSGAVNVASLSSVFGHHEYARFARLSGVLAICLLVGGLSILVLDLGRPDRLIVAMTEYNFSSIFAWNVLLYSGFVTLLAVYVWFAMERRMNHLTRSWGKLVFAWRIVLTTGTGCIFGFLVAREGYDAPMLAPTFIAMSLSIGTAVFLLTALVLFRQDSVLPDALVRRLGRLLALFVLASVYLSLVFHLANGYAAEHDGWERFVLHDGGGYTTIFWIGQVIFGSFVPLALLWSPLGGERAGVLIASTLVVIGGFAQLYVIIIAGQAYPMDLVPGWEVIETTFMDGQVAPYAPSAPEWLLGLGGTAFAYLALALAMRVLALAPNGQEPTGDASRQASGL
jgi:Ni/Fe-hydrogenase subunit HybB-like protein